MAAEGKALERRIARTPARSTAEIVLKLNMALCPLLLSGRSKRLVESAAGDLEEGSPAGPFR